MRTCWWRRPPRPGRRSWQGRHRPHTSLHVDLKDLLGLPGHGRRPLLARFGLVSTPTAARVACDSRVQLIVTHGARLLHVGRRHRLVNDAQRTALAHTHPTCVLPGCQVRFGDCDIHHLWWSQHGPTDYDLQVPLCRSHHIWLHEGGYCLTRDHGHLVFRDRRGRVIANTTDVLTAQLDLLDQRLQPPHPEPAPGDPDLAQALTDLDSRTTTPYDHGTWGWNGPNPSPPPGHAPPQDGDR
jgi:hypothetical protein